MSRPNVADHPLKSAIDHSLGRPLPHQQTNQVQAHPMVHKAFSVNLSGISTFPRVIPGHRVDTYMLLTRLPLSIATSFDLHVLGVPPAYVLSHDQTLKFKNGAH